MRYWYHEMSVQLLFDQEQRQCCSVNVVINWLAAVPYLQPMSRDY